MEVQNQLQRSIQGKKNNTKVDFEEPVIRESEEIIFVGKSNVGKSTLINLLFNMELAKVSKVPVSEFYL